MKKIAALFACFLAACLPLSAAIVRVQTVISRVAGDGKTDLLGAPSVTTIGGRVARTPLNNLELILVAVPAGDKNDGFRIHARLLDKTAGKSSRVDFAPVTVIKGQPALVEADGFRIELSARIDEPPSLTINFAGGTLGDLLASLPKDGPIFFNLVGEKTDLATEIPPLSYRATSAEELSVLLNKIVSSRQLSITAAPSSPFDITGRRSVYLLQRIIDPEANLAPGAPRFRSYPMANYLTEKQTIDAVTDAIRTAWAMIPNTKPEDLNLKFHPNTDLLLVAGSADATRVAETVIAGLTPRYASPANLPEIAGRLNRVAKEVRARRALRAAQAQVLESDTGSALDRAEQALRDAQRPAIAENHPTASTPPPGETPAEAAQRYQKTRDDARARRLGREESAAETQKRLETIRAEVERLRASRPSSSPAEPAPATPPPPETPATK